MIQLVFYSMFISHRPFRFDQMGQWDPLILSNGPMGASHLVKTKRTMTDERATAGHMQTTDEENHPFSEENLVI